MCITPGMLTICLTSWASDAQTRLYSGRFRRDVKQAQGSAIYRGVASEGPCCREASSLLVFPDLSGRRFIPPA
jgi:hypothetical protein